MLNSSGEVLRRGGQKGPSPETRPLEIMDNQEIRNAKRKKMEVRN